METYVTYPVKRLAFQKREPCVFYVRKRRLISCISCSEKESRILYFIETCVCCIRKDTRHLKKDTRHLKKDTRHLRKDTQHLNSVLHRDVCCMSCQETRIRCRAALGLLAEYRLFYRSLLQKRPTLLRSLQVGATPYPFMISRF